MSWAVLLPPRTRRAGIGPAHRVTRTRTDLLKVDLLEISVIHHHLPSLQGAVAGRTGTVQAATIAARQRRVSRLLPRASRHRVARGRGVAHAHLEASPADVLTRQRAGKGRVNLLVVGRNSEGQCVVCVCV